MTQHFKNMLYLFGANARGIEAKIDGELNIEEIRRLSMEQGIWTLVYPELAELCDASKYQMDFFQRVSKGIAQKEFTLGVIKKLEESDIRCCLLKGASVSGLYADPGCRISGDTDILIDPKDEEKLKKELLEIGYQVDERTKNEHHLKAYHSKGGLLEAHVMLYSKVSERVLFNGLNMYSEPWATMEINGYPYHVLGINDGLIYLTAHYIKHLVNEGGGVRQMMDLLLYIEKYNGKLDFDRYNKILKELKYDKLIEVIMSIGAKYFGCPYEIKNEDLIERLLADSEKGGIFGYSTDERRNFYSAYCDKRQNMSKYEYKLFLMLKDEKSIFNKIFPTGSKLVTVYGYGYAENRWLVPVAWINRWFDVIFRKFKKKTPPKIENINETQKRMQMMRDLGMIK